MKRIALYLLLFAFSSNIYANDKLQQILKSELQREFTELQKNELVPYYLSYRVDDIKTCYASASFGSLNRAYTTERRILTPEVRIGNYDLDNTHEIRDSYGSSTVNNESSNSTYLPIDDEELAIKQRIWSATNGALKTAENRYEKVKANIAVKIEEEDKSADFSKITPERHYEKPLNFKVDQKEWERKVCEYSSIFSENKDVISASTNFSYQQIRKYFLSSEGAEIVHNLSYALVSIYAVVKADNGMELPLQKSYFAFTPDKLPSNEVIKQDIKKLSATLTALKTAPDVEPYSGPAVLSAEAAGVFFHEIFGHRIEGQRLRSETDGQTFKKKVGQKVLNENLSVSMDPTLKTFNGNDLNGYYKYDEQGVKGEKVEVVKNGILKGFLMSRTPIEGFPKSNGHARAEAGRQPTTRQSNLIVTSSKPQSESEIRSLLIEEAKKQGKEYGYLFASVVGGFTNTGRYSPNSFNVTPTEVYRIYVDGRTDELVRGVNLVGTPLSMFAQIDYAGDNYEIFTGQCGAESGRVPVTTIAPMLLVRNIEVQKKPKSQNTLPLLERPEDCSK